jgi:hypothetical protein
MPPVQSGGVQDAVEPCQARTLEALRVLPISFALEAKDIRDDIVSLCWLEAEIRHPLMVGVKEHPQGQGGRRGKISDFNEICVKYAEGAWLNAVTLSAPSSGERASRFNVSGPTLSADWLVRCERRCKQCSKKKQWTWSLLSHDGLFHFS